MNTHSMTQEGFDKLKVELDHIRADVRPKAVARLKVAREMGDLSENSEYSAAREDLSFIDGRIAEIEEILKNATIAVHGADKSHIEIGDTVTISADGEAETYTIVGEHEADMLQNKLSQTSPIGSSILGRKKGDSVEVTTPAGNVTYKIVEIK